MTEVIDMKPVFVNALKSVTELKSTRTNYPKDWKSVQFPMAIYRASKKPHYLEQGYDEWQTYWTVVIELYANNGSLTSIKNSLLESFAQIGFTGKWKDGNTAGLKRIEIELKAIVDNNLKTIYRA